MMSGLVFEKLLQTMAAGQDWRLNIAGDFFRLSGAQWPVSVALVKDLRIVGVMTNMLAGDYVRDIDFDGVIITNGSVGQDVSVQIAGGGAGSDRVMGEVSVIDGGKFRTLGGKAFWGSYTKVPSAGNYPAVQLWNPVGSGVRLCVEQLMFGNYTATGIVLFHIGINNVAGDTPRSPLSKLSGGAASVAEMRVKEGAALWMPAGAYFGDVYQAVGQSMPPFTPKEPFVINQGSGLVVEGDVSKTISVNFEFYEEAM